MKAASVVERLERGAHTVRFIIFNQQTERAPNVTEVRTRLREAILRSELPPATVHSQDEVRTFLGVGRTPIREALRMVQAEGLIEVLANGRLKIPELSIDDSPQIQLSRIALESAAVRLSVLELTPDDFAHLE